MRIGEKIRLFRKAEGLTQKELGEKIGMSDAQIRNYESGRANPKIDTLKRIAVGLGVPLDNLYSDIAPAEANPSAMTAIINKAVTSRYREDGENLLMWIPKYEGDTDGGRVFSDLLRCRSILGKLTPEARKIFLQRGEELASIPKYRNKKGKED